MKPMLMVTLALAIGCGNSGGTSSDQSKLGALADKVKGVGDKVGGALDKLDTGEATDKLAAAKASLAGGLEASDECDWASRQQASSDPAVAATVGELKKLCALDVPVARAQKALVKAEAAKASDPQSKELTECSSDDWARAAQQIAGSPFSGDPKWTDLTTRWSKVCHL